jgi:hypothetical protein
MKLAGESSTISGENIFFNFIELPYDNLAESRHLISQLKSGEIHGFVMKDVFKPHEIAEIKNILSRLTDEQVLATPSGRLFPAPFAIITDAQERLDTYYDKLNKLYTLMGKEPALKSALEKLDLFFKAVGGDYQVKVPSIKLRHTPVSVGTFRMFHPHQGGLHVHCGNLFQAQSEFYYSLIEEDIDKNDQLSYFLLIQEAESGGELTIYDMLWKDVKRKISQEENNSVIDDNDNIIYLKNVPSFAVKPLPGDILVFAGGPIWHRVEDIKGSISRITLGGFLNFSKDGKEIYYWS